MIMAASNDVAHMDHSGSEPQSPVCVVAGFVASAELWQNFSDEWDRVMREQPSIEHFKMREAQSLRGQFDGWSEAQRDRKLVSLANVILRFKPLLLDAVVRWSDYARIVSGRVLQQIDHPFFVGFHSVIGMMAHAKRAGQYPRVVDFIFDDGSPFADAALIFYCRLVDHARTLPDRALLDSLGATPVRLDDKQVLPLQAADMLASLIRRKLDQSLPENSDPSYMHPVLQMLDQLRTNRFDKLIGDAELKKYVECFS